MIGIETQKEVLARLMESQFWSRERIGQLQRHYLAHLLKHARAHAPFYKNRLDIAFDSRGEVQWDKWNDIPILTRQDLSDHQTAMTSLALPWEHGRTRQVTTSGSTGIAITTVTSEYANLAAKMANHRGQSWHGVDWSKDVLFYMEEKSPAGVWPNAEVGPPWGPAWLPQSKGRFLRLNGSTPPGQVVDFIASRDQVRYLSCRAKVAQVVALESMRTGRPAKLDGVFAFSTATYDDEREDIKRAFGAKVLSFYASKEAHMMAYQCPVHHNLHVSEELVLLEILDDQGRPVPKGTMGHVVVTNLLNLAQPLIRYRHGDLAVEGGECSCGRTLRVLDKIVGRESDMFRFPDGSAVAFGVPGEFKTNFNIKTWQIAQVEPLRLEVRYATISDDRPVDFPALTAALRAMTHPDVAIGFTRTDSFLPPDGRKFTEYVNELNRRKTEGTSQ
jgi:phenylacetate-CoA ligase